MGEHINDARDMMRKTSGNVRTREDKERRREGASGRERKREEEEGDRQCRLRLGGHNRQRGGGRGGEGMREETDNGWTVITTGCPADRHAWPDS